jgi:hypothetical protein
MGNPLNCSRHGGTDMTFSSCVHFMVSVQTSLHCMFTLRAGCCHLQGPPFQIGLNCWSHPWDLSRRWWIKYTHLMWLWGGWLHKIPSLGSILYGTNRSLKVAVLGPVFGPTFYIHTYIRAGRKNFTIIASICARSLKIRLKRKNILVPLHTSSVRIFKALQWVYQAYV